MSSTIRKVRDSLAVSAQEYLDARDYKASVRVGWTLIGELRASRMAPGEMFVFVTQGPVSTADSGRRSIERSVSAQVTVAAKYEGVGGAVDALVDQCLLLREKLEEAVILGQIAPSDGYSYDEFADAPRSLEPVLEDHFLESSTIASYFVPSFLGSSRLSLA